MEAKFTPGPWVVYKDLPTDVVVSENGDCSLATLDCGCGSRENQRANAALIAAAPDLYTALSLFVEYNELMEAGADVAGMLKYAELMDAAPKALAKARGETPET
ncbi:hypothetical protein AZ09_10530 [Acetobacter aceti 1023]|nr:hypothetical protein AZ09_10530 [Acetobacter aceti 1023]